MHSTILGSETDTEEEDGVGKFGRRKADRGFKKNKLILIN